MTINPHDLTSSVIPVLVGIDLDEWFVMSPFERAKIVAERPDAAAIVFDLQIRAFLDIIIKFKHGPGVFGHCHAYYGTVEAQGRGTLHCHMLLWITGNPSPQELHDKMTTDEQFKGEMFSWLENIISCELP